MKNPNLLLLIFALLFSLGACLFAQDNQTEEIPPGMETIQVGTAKAIAPKGTKVYKRDNIITMESTQEFLARKVVEIEGRLTELEDEKERLKKDIEELKQNWADKDKQTEKQDAQKENSPP